MAFDEFVNDGNGTWKGRKGGIRDGQRVVVFVPIRALPEVKKHLERA